MAAKSFPKRPTTPDREAIMACERLLVFLLMRLAQKGIIDHDLEKLRHQFVMSPAQKRPLSESEQKSRDHTDWIFAFAQTGLRKGE